MKLAIGLSALVAFGAATVHYLEDFSGDAESRWVQSAKKSDYGKFAFDAGKNPADPEASKGIRTSQDARFYSISSKIEKPIDTTAGTGVLVLQYSARHEQWIDCGGGYLKVLPADFDQKNFHGETPYYIMFGPDQCGVMKKIHVIFNHNGENLNWKKELQSPNDDQTHLYTLVVDTKKQTYEVHVDGEKKESGNLEDDWAFLKPKEIDDPSDKKPSDWVDDAEIDDPEDVKPEGYDDIPATIADPDAKRPDDWDEEEDGQWEAPTIANPAYKGEWRAKRIPNPAYKGVWAPRRIPNPDYVEDKALASYKDIGGVGFDLWQVKSGTVFDNILIADDLDDAEEYAHKTYHALKEAEKTAKDKKAAEDAAAAPKEEEAPVTEAGDAPEAEDDEGL